ncbi:MAG: LysE family translocator [Acinetobacter sp.]|nr:MAG: LysE family translocator [Acinetobacter sp.]
MNVTEYVLYCLAVIVMIATPGPVMLLVASAGLRGGYSAALRTIFGTNFASLILIGLSVLTLKGLLVINENWLNAIQLLGCLYIAYLGFGLLKEVWAGQAEVGLHLKPVQGGFKTGFLVGISNPKDIIFFASFFPQFVTVTPHLDMSLRLLTLSWIVLDFATLSIVYFSFNKLSQSRCYSKLLGMCAAILILVAGYGIYSVVSSFF